MKKLLSLVIALALCLGLVAALAEEWPAIGSPDAPVTVKVVCKDVFPDEEDVVNLCKAINEKMAAHGQYVNVEYIDPPASGYASAMPLAVMNGEVDADIIYFQGGDQAVSAQGLLEDLTPYIEGSTFVKSIMEDSNVVKMQNYPYLLWLAPSRISTPGVRSDLAAQTESFAALMADPTVDNYVAFMKELKDKGLTVYGLTADGGLARFDTIFNHAFGVTGTCVKEDGKWIFSKASQAEKNKLAFYAQLYADGLIDPDFLTNTWDVMEQRWYEGTAAIVAGTAGGTVQVYDTKMTSLYGDAGALTILPPAKGISQSYTSIDVTKEPRGFAINVDSKNKDAAWAVMEFMASPEGRILDKVGVEGVQYNVVDNKIVFTDRFAGWWARFWDTTYKFNPQDPSLEKWVLTDAAAKSLEMVTEYAVMDHSLLIPDYLTPQWDAMTNLYNEFAADVIRGVKSIDAFDEFVEQWNAAGGNDFSDLLQETFAE
ncbi:MAG: extracellular solute-binding protein [Clostridiales bacterium]|nr:extracellular solute-binding protein [Clostridiales bacterium]